MTSEIQTATVLDITLFMASLIVMQAARHNLVHDVLDSDTDPNSDTDW